VRRYCDIRHSREISNENVKIFSDFRKLSEYQSRKCWTRRARSKIEGREIQSELQSQTWSKDLVGDLFRDENNIKTFVKVIICKDISRFWSLPYGLWHRWTNYDDVSKRRSIVMIVFGYGYDGYSSFIVTRVIRGAGIGWVTWPKKGNVTDDDVSKLFFGYIFKNNLTIGNDRMHGFYMMSNKFASLADSMYTVMNFG
jgi:hypothetical protein